MTAAQLAARRKGGEACMKLYGREFYGALGAMGGRPRAITLMEVELAQSRSAIIRERKEGNPSTGSLTALRRLWAKQTGR